MKIKFQIEHLKIYNLEKVLFRTYSERQIFHMSILFAAQAKGVLY